MDYYERTKKAYLRILELSKIEGISINVIRMKIVMEYGLSENFVDKKLELLVENGNIEIIGGKIKRL